MKMRIVVLFVLAAALSGWAQDAQLERAKLELLVSQAGELLADSERKGSETHTPTYQYFFGLVYGCGTNLLSRADGVRTKQLTSQYMRLVGKCYDAYTKVEEAAGKAVATGSDRSHGGRHLGFGNGYRHRAKRIANVEKMRDAELTKAIRDWESFAVQLKRLK